MELRPPFTVPARSVSSALLLAAMLLASPARAEESPTPLEDNRRITLGYIEILNELQAILDPNFQPGGTSSVRPNWFCFAPHASQAAGKGMVGTALARRLITAARGWPSFSLSQALDRLGLSSAERPTVQRLAVELLAHGLPYDVAAALGALATGLNGEALLDPRTSSLTAARFAALYWSAPAFWPLDRAESVVLTLERTLHEGNLAIFSDVGGAGRAFLDWRRGAGAVTPERVLTEFTIPGARPEEARLAYDFARAHAFDVPRPSQMDALFPGMDWRSLLVAAFALYEQSPHAATPAERDALIAMGNNYIAWREQHDQVQPVFTPPLGAADEVSRAGVLQGLTPMLTTDFGTLEWNFSDYAYARGERDGNLLTSPPTEHNWAFFPDRWAAILYLFDMAYLQPTAVWALPTPLNDPFEP